jgi:flagellar basal body-associated protein FliL
MGVIAMEQKSGVASSGTGKRSRKILFFCIMVLLALILLGIIMWFIPTGKSTTLYEMLNVSIDEITQIDISNGAGPQKKVTNADDIRQLLAPFKDITIRKNSSFKTFILNYQMQQHIGSQGLYYVIYKNGSPYVHLEYLKPRMFNICPHDQAKNKVLYSASQNIDATSINDTLIKYGVNGI